MSDDVTIFTLGYGGWRIEDVAELARLTNALVVDVRFSPQSRNPTWRLATLKKRLAHRYEWVQEWGNRNYRGGPIELVDFEGGVQRVMDLVAEREARAVVLLCGCRDVGVCHRKDVAERLRTFWCTSPVIHLESPARGTGSLF